MRSSVLVLGATGRFGAAATEAFAAAGWQVFAQRRPQPGRSAAPANVTCIDAAPMAAALRVQAMAGRIDAVVHAMNPAYTTTAWRTQAPQLMADAIAAARLLKALLLFPGNVYNFGADLPRHLKEPTPQRPTHEKGEIRAALERTMQTAFDVDGVRSVVLRAGDFYGHGAGSLLDRLLARSLRSGRITLPGDLHTATPWAYLPDLARTFVAVAERRAQVRGAEVLHFAGHQLTGADWAAELQRVAIEAGCLREGAAATVKRLPWPLIRAGGLLIPTWASLAEVRYLWTTPHALDNTRLVERIGAEPHTPFPTALREALCKLPQLLPAPAGLAAA